MPALVTMAAFIGIILFFFVIFTKNPSLGLRETVLGLFIFSQLGYSIEHTGPQWESFVVALFAGAWGWTLFTEHLEIRDKKKARSNRAAPRTKETK